MNENTGNNGNEFFYDLLDNPADLSHSNAFNLQLLINDFPQSGLLRSMLAVKREEQSLQSASAYVNPKLLYKIANTLGALSAVSDDQVAFCEKPGQQKPALPLPGNAQIPHLTIDESNYFHVPIEADLIHTGIEEDVALLEDDVDAPYVENDAENGKNSSEVLNPDTAAPAEVDGEAIHENEVVDEAAYAPLYEAEETGEEPVENVENAVDETAAGEEDLLAENEEPEKEEGDTTAEQLSALLADTNVETATDETADSDDVQPVENEDPEKVEDCTTEGLSVQDDDAHVETATDEIADSEDIQPVENEDPEKLVDDKTAEQVLAQEEEPYNESATTPTEEHEALQPTGHAQNQVTETDASKIGNKPTSTHQEIDDEVFEEIVSIEDISLEQLAILDKTTVIDEADAVATSNEQQTEEEPTGDSYFVFEPALPEDDVTHAPASITVQGNAGQRISKYNDEKMPYSFMWWLDKTRKEHAAIYQPFAVEGKFHSATVDPAEKPRHAADHLQQQYVENIFAVTAAVSDLNITPPKVDPLPVETKEDKIIEKFIHEEPQIKHPSKVKLDNENKAKKSSEDKDELVTETLAKIYTEQMLYHKAILTYKKLMLKFPEKSLYFAGQIEQLENKIN